MMDLKFDKVSKRYRIQRDDNGKGSSHLIGKIFDRARSHEFWAVKDVSFEVNRGESLGIIGHNGAGKSTILKLLSNITTPTKGEITIKGHLAALIEVGSGFHPELTGRENIYLSGSILGMRRHEIASKLDAIVDFAGIAPFIDTPVKRYSSGMYVRLGFSIAAHLDPDILLLDEVLAVGDMSFQAKCLERISQLKRSGRTIVFISHDLGAVERLCDRVLLLQRGEIKVEGRPKDVIAKYRAMSDQFVASQPPGDRPAHLSKEATITLLTFHPNNPGVGIRTGEALTISLEYNARQKISDAVFEIFFYSADNELQCHLTTGLSHDRVDLNQGIGRVEFFCPELVLLPGVYYVDATIIVRGQALGSAIDWQYHCAMLRVDGGKTVRGHFLMPHTFRVVQIGERNRRELPDEIFLSL